MLNCILLFGLAVLVAAEDSCRVRPDALEEKYEALLAENEALKAENEELRRRCASDHELSSSDTQMEEALEGEAGEASSADAETEATDLEATESADAAETAEFEDSQVEENVDLHDALGSVPSVPETSGREVAPQVITSTQAGFLTIDTFEEETAGKSVFIKFMAPWCGACAEARPSWDKLRREYAGTIDTLIAQVDCTVEEHRYLCDEHGVRSYPTFKYGVVPDLQFYEGSREFEDLKAFALNNLDPMCSPQHVQACDADAKAKIRKFKAMTVSTLRQRISAKKAEMTKLAEDYELRKQTIEVRLGQAKGKLSKSKAAIDKENGLELMRACQMTMGS